MFIINCKVSRDFSRVVSLLQATLCDVDLINLGMPSSLMYVDCAMFTPTESQATMQVSVQKNVNVKCQLL